MKEANFHLEPRNKFAEATREIVEHEIRSGNTVSFFSEVDLTAVERVRSIAAGRKPSYTAFVVKAVALALREFPYANRRVHRPGRFIGMGARLQKFHRCDVAVAVERDFPGAEATAFIDIVREAEQKSLVEITEQLQRLATCDTSNNRQWREFSGVISRLPVWLSSWLIRLPCFFPSLWVKWRGGAVLISSPAKYGIDVVAGSWTHPLGFSFGLVKMRPVVRDGAVVPCATFTLTMNFDRRVMAGAQAARFFRQVTSRLERMDAEMTEEHSAGAPVSAEERPAERVSSVIEAPIARAA